MDNKEIRLIILEYLIDIYYDDPYYDVANTDFLKENPKITEIQLKSNIKYLEEKGNINVNWFGDDLYLFRINSFGIDEVENSKDKKSQNISGKKLPNDIVYELINETYDLVTENLKRINTMQKLKKARGGEIPYPFLKIN